MKKKQMQEHQAVAHKRKSDPFKTSKPAKHGFNSGELGKRWDDAFRKDKTGG